MPPPSAPPPSSARPAAVRQFGRFGLLRLLGKSQRTMAWLVGDPRSAQELVLMLPRNTPAGDDGLERWLQRARKAARLDHPHLARPVDIGVHEGWPYMAYELGEMATLADRIGHQGLAAEEAATLAVQALQALAYAHDAGIAHRDVQPFAVLVSDKGAARLMGLEITCLESVSGAELDAQARLQQRAAAEADVLQLGVLLHPLLTGQPALDEPDTGRVAERLPPHGREIVRLPFATPRPVPEALRVIVNRATDRQERQRYRNARTLARALEGWLQVEGSKDNGALALVLDRIRAAGVLPAAPGSAERAARLALMERGRNDELAEVLLDDVGLAFELLRAVNTAQVRGGQVSGAGPVLTVRRAIAMIGLEGVRRVALSLRPWPGPLAPGAAEDLSQALHRARRAGRVAIAVRPAGYDGEVVYLIALLQNLGRLVVQYHLPDEAQQIRRLMQPAPAEPDQPEEPGMSEQAAAMAVLGVDLESIGIAVGRWWGLDDSVMHLMRRLSTSAGVRTPENDDEHLRAAASCANETIDALAQPPARVAHALHVVAQRYGRVLSLTLKDLQAALQGGTAPAAAAAGTAGVAP
ncbi:MAG: HDOD domain-containing protein [Rubrivivax sp.]